MIEVASKNRKIELPYAVNFMSLSVFNITSIELLHITNSLSNRWSVIKDTIINNSYERG